MHAPFVFSSIQPYLSIAFAVLFYLQFAWGGAPPHLQWSFPHDNHCYKLSHSKVAGRGPPLLSSLAGLFIYSSVWDCPSPTLRAQGAQLSLLHFFFFPRSLFIIQFVFSPSGQGGQSVQGLC
jgi:hypothetical protein